MVYLLCSLPLLLLTSFFFQGDLAKGMIKSREAEDKTDVNTTCVSDEDMIVKRSASKRHYKYVGELHVFNCIFMLTITLLRTFEQKEPFCKIALCFQTWCHLMIALDNLMSMLVFNWTVYCYNTP